MTRILTRLVTIFGAKGGLGRSTLAANLGLALANQGAQRVALVDLDWLAGGTLASQLDLEPCRHHWGDWVNDHATLEQVLIKHGSGVRLVPAPPAGEAVIPAAYIVALLNQLAAEHSTIVVDTCWPHISPLMLPLFDLASVILVVTTPEIHSLQATKDLLDRARDLHFPTDRLQIILNRDGVTADIGAKDVENTLKRALWARIPYDKAVVTALNRGVPLYQGVPQHAVSKAVKAVAERVMGLAPIDLSSRGQTYLTQAAQEAARPFPTALLETDLPEVPFDTPPGPFTEPQALQVVETDTEQLRLYKLQIHDKLVEQMKLEDIPFERLADDPNFKDLLREQVAERANRLLDELNLGVATRAERLRLVLDVANEAIGYGPLEGFLADDSVSEIMVNGPNQIFVEQKGRLMLTDRSFTDEKQLRVVIDRIVAPIGRRVDESSPMCDARLPDGSRVNVVIAPLALNGSTLTIRKFSRKRLTIADLVGFQSMTAEMAEFLEACVLAKLNIFISGGTGSGKTTLLNVLSGFIPSDERIVTIEDAAELRLHQSHVISLEARPPNIEGTGAISIRELVRNSLRMRPDRIIVGEVRGGEALDMLQAMNTGHDGSLATGHANTPRDALARLETMVLMAGMDLPVRAIREQIASAIHIIVQQSRLSDGTRKVVRITEVTGMEGDIITLQDLFEYKQTGRNLARVEGKFQSLGMRPHYLDQMTSMGLSLPPTLFVRGDLT